MSNQIAIDGLPPKDKTTNENNNLKRRWENGFQKWSNEQAQDGSTPLGKCGYSNICDYCTDNCYGRPCVRALNEMCRDRKITIDYTKKNYQEIWESSNGN